MPGLFSNLHVDRLSFWLGFIAATLLWWLVWRWRSYWPLARDYVRKRAQQARLKSLTSVDERLRRETLRRAQGMHVSSPLFSLDEVLIPPRFLAPPPRVDPGVDYRSDPVISLLIPYLPEWPELPTELHYPTLSLGELLQGGRNLVIIGRPGTGKSVTLAYLASLIARRNPLAASLAQKLPIHLHVNDLILPIPEKDDPLGAIIPAILENAPAMIRPQVPGYLRSIFQQGGAVFLLDGLDELSREALGEASDFLARLLKAYPGLRVITCGSSDYLDGLIQLGFAPVVLAAWDSATRRAFIERWAALWERTMVDSILPPEDGRSADWMVLKRWLLDGDQGSTPLEITLKIWSLYAGDIRGNALQDAFEAYIRRVVPDPRYRPALERLALQMALNGRTFVHQSQLSALAAEIAGVPIAAKTNRSQLPAQNSRSSPATSIAAMLKIGQKGQNPSAKRRARPEAPLRDVAQPSREAQPAEPRQSTVQRVVMELANNGLIALYPNERVGFTNPVLASYLASRLPLEPGISKDYTSHNDRGILGEIFRFTAARADITEAVSLRLQEKDTLFYRGLFSAARWLRDAAPDARWRGVVMRRLFTVLQDETLPMAVRFQSLAAFVQSADPSVSVLFRQLLSSPSPALRQMAAFGCAAIRKGTAEDELIGLLSDEVVSVRQTACLALASLGTPSALQAVNEMLDHGDEELRRSAAEALAYSPGEGHELLRKASASENLLTRRASVFGLIQVNETWANEILSKMRIEDGQWVVRNAAVQALENVELPDARIPRPLPPPWQAPWLIAFASKQGEGIPAGDEAIELLMKAFKEGCDDERLAALEYLRRRPEERIVQALLEAVHGEQGVVREAAYHALWMMALGGLPHPQSEPQNQV